MTNRLADKVAVVTGSGRGLGRSMVLLLAKEGAKVVVNDLGAGADGMGVSKVADEVVAEIKNDGGTAVANYDSVATREGAENVIKTAIDNFGKIDILVNNAGILRDRMIWNMTDEEWDGVIKTHLYGHFYCTRAAVIKMRELIKAGKQKNGRIINFASHAGIEGSPGQPNYAAAKMGIVGFTYSCANALGRYGITCNAVTPLAQTRMTDTVPEDMLRQHAIRDLGIKEAETMPLDQVKKLTIGGTPDAIAPLICWLASDETSHITGQVFVITEGRVGLFSHMEESKLAYKDGMFSVDEIWRIMPLITAGLKNPAAGH